MSRAVHSGLWFLRRDGAVLRLVAPEPSSIEIGADSTAQGVEELVTAALEEHMTHSNPVGHVWYDKADLRDVDGDANNGNTCTAGTRQCPVAACAT